MSRAALRLRLGFGDHDDGSLELATTDARNAVAQALALEPALPLLEAIEEWLGTTLTRLEPVAALDWPDDGRALNLGVRGLGRLALPWSALRVGQRLVLPERFVVDWPTLACDLVFESLAHDRLALHELLPGSVVLLPASFAKPSGAPIALQLRPHRGWPRLEGLRWDASRERLGFDAPALRDPTPGPAVAPWEVVAAEPCAIDASCWFGGAATAAAPAPPRQVALRHLGDVVASGRLVPVGSGIGMLVDACHGHAIQAA